MKKISTNAILEISNNFKLNFRSLENELFRYHFTDYGNEELFLEELIKFQNLDGGFGNGIEPDFKLNESSPMATSIGLKYLNGFTSEKAKKMAIDAVKYLELTFNEERQGWFAVPEEVNNYPHAPWWEHKKELQMTVIDLSWGNPTAELLGYLYRYREYVTKLDLETIIGNAIWKLNNENILDSEHEIYSYIKLYIMLDSKRAFQIEETLKKAVLKLVVTNEAEWDNYVPTPVSFLCKKLKECFLLDEELINKNLDYLVDKLNTNYKITPAWIWSDYLEEWEIAKKEWQGILTLDALFILDKFGRR